MQFWPPDDEHMCSKHVEAEINLLWNKILCIKMVNYWDKYTGMHGQQNFQIWRFADRASQYIYLSN